MAAVSFLWSSASSEQKLRLGGEEGFETRVVRRHLTEAFPVETPQ